MARMAAWILQNSAFCPDWLAGRSTLSPWSVAGENYGSVRSGFCKGSVRYAQRQSRHEPVNRLVLQCWEVRSQHSGPLSFCIGVMTTSNLVNRPSQQQLDPANACLYEVSKPPVLSVALLCYTAFLWYSSYHV